MLPTYYRDCWHVVSRSFLIEYCQVKVISYLYYSSPITEVYNPRTFILHAALLGQGFPHCRILPTAASRRSLDRVSVPVWPITLSGRLPIIGLVGRYPTNYLMGREPIHKRISLTPLPCGIVVLCGISSRFQLLSPSYGQVAHALLTRPPLSQFIFCPKASVKSLRSTCMC